MSSSRDDEVLRRGAVLLSALVLTKNEGLERFRTQRVRDDRVTDEHLRQARTVLDAVTYALLGDNPDNWKRIEEAHRILRRNEAPKAPKIAHQQSGERQSPPVPPPERPASSVRSAATAVASLHAEPSWSPWVGKPSVEPPSPPPAPSLTSSGHGAGLRETAPTDEAIVPHRSSPTPVVAQPTTGLEETATLDPAMFAHLSPPIPFEGVAESPPTAVDAPADFAGETGVLDLAAIADDVAPYPMPTKLPMAVERYAALVARSDGASEAEVAELHREYGVADVAHRKRIDQELSDALARDAPLRHEFAGYLRQWREWLRTQRNE